MVISYFSQTGLYLIKLVEAVNNDVNVYDWFGVHAWDGCTSNVDKVYSYI